MKELKHLLALGFVVIAICVVGTFDYNEEVISHMSNGTYEAMKEKMGSDVSTSELVEAYMSDREYWDSLGQLK